jgi:hypothetical protein
MGNAVPATLSPSSRLSGVTGGALLAFAVLTLSFLIGKLEVGAFLKSLLAIAIAGGVGAFVASEFQRHYIAKAYQQQLSLLSVPSRETDVVPTLDRALERIERLLENEVGRLAELIDIEDTHLAEIEAASLTKEVAICRQEMGCELEVDDPSRELFERVVEDNLERGVHYCWVSENTGVNRQRAATLRARFATHQEAMNILLVPPATWKELPFSFEAVFFVQIDSKGTRHLLGYADVSFGNESARSWRKVGNRNCAEWYDQIDQVRTQATST